MSESMEISTMCKRPYPYVRSWGEGTIEEYEEVKLQMITVSGIDCVRIEHNGNFFWTSKDKATHHFYKALTRGDEPRGVTRTCLVGPVERIRPCHGRDTGSIPVQGA